MAAPADKTIKNLNGKWVMGPKSDDADPLLQLQGISWIVRKGIGMATVTLSIRSYVTDADQKQHVDIHSRATGGIQSTELRTVDWTWREHKDNIFGECLGRSRLCSPDDLALPAGGEGGADDDDDNTQWLKQGWIAEEEGGKVLILQSFVKSTNPSYPWTANQLWGFQMIDGKRYHARNIIVRKGEEAKRARFVYDYHGPLDKTKAEDDGLAYGE